MRFHGSWALSALVCVAFASMGGCKETEKPVSGTVLRPAEVNMAGYEQVVLEPIQGEGGDLITARLRQRLVEAKFVVLDRQSMKTRDREKTLGDLGQAAPSDTPTPKVMTAAVVIRGSVNVHDFTPMTNTKVVTNTQTGRSWTQYQATGAAKVDVAFEIVDLQTTKTIAAPFLKGEDHGASDWSDSPTRLDPKPMFRIACDGVVAQFMQAVASHSEQFSSFLYLDDKNTANTTGVGLFATAEYGGAAKEFESAVAFAKAQPEVKSETLARLTHNIGLAYEFAGDDKMAVAAYKGAIVINSEKTLAQQSINRCAQRSADAKKLKEQGISTGSK